ncbi:selenite/tellurite reduction operon protein ExtJ [Limisalsivibrio acetivorans]|uniref:selenite/tellurite reduction operon protein ExtJ n=1 Tax=Limisalsivibrio acetivorans TaxID=1304888 RepID=UPI0003B3CAFC|nr:hypothetical protein [Limisalsivibrio acetivorans]
MKKKLIVLVLAVSLAVAGIAYAASSASGKVVSKDGNNVTIKLQGNLDVKAGDKVKIKAMGGGNSGGAGFQLQGC